MKIKFCLIVLALIVAASSFGGFRAGQFWQHRAERKTAIAYECGQYNAKTGEFEWIKPVPQITAAMLDMPTMPTPKAKPTHVAKK